ncbi:MAG TPA: DUF427 domain-containing protein [Chloroflexota bacterium]|nr:DUF427 domain-containing protein [Chloroflexota bacterium]
MSQLAVPLTNGGPPSAEDYWAIAEPSPRRVRVVFAGETIADSRRVMLFRERGHLPVYYFPRGDVRTDLLVPSGRTETDAQKGTATFWNVRAGSRVAEQGAWRFNAGTPQWPEMSEYIAFDWPSMDAWYEEDEEVFVHPRDPYKRVDVLASTRHVRVVLGGVTVADSHRPRLLFETGLPTRYYLPPEDVRLDLLHPTDTHTRCPYKGIASYWSVRVGDQTFDDIVWSYPEPIPECPKVAGLLCFFNERVDALYVDEELQPRPKTRWSRD